jgi:hypothetical protein
LVAQGTCDQSGILSLLGELEKGGREEAGREAGRQIKVNTGLGKDTMIQELCVGFRWKQKLRKEKRT